MSESKMPPLPKTLPGELHGEHDGLSAVPVPPKRGIEVRALQRGFIYQDRKEEGDVFTLSDEKHLGGWMECIDPVLQKKHAANTEAKRKRINARKDEVEAGD